MYLKQIFILLVFPIMLAAQEEMTLEKAISIGLENNYGIKIADTNIRIADNNNTWARAGSGITVDLNGSFTNSLINNKNPASFIQGSYYVGGMGASLEANWVVLNGGRVEVSKDILSQTVNEEKLNQQVGIQEVLRNIYIQYYEVLFQQERQVVLRNTLVTSKGRLDYEQTKKEYGASNSYNLIQFENGVVIDSIELIKQTQNVELAKRNLYNTLDLSTWEEYLFPEELILVVEEIDPALLKKTLSEENYTLKTLSVLAELNSLNTRLAESSRKPTLTLNGSLGITENGFKLFDENPNTGDPFKLQLSNQLQASVSAFLNWNLYDGGVRKSDIQNAQLQEDLTQLTVLEAQVRLNNQLEILISNYKNQRILLEMSEQQLQLAKRNMEMTEERFRAGQISSMDYRVIQNQYLNAAFARVNAIYMMIMTKIEMDYLVGQFGS